MKVHELKIGQTIYDAYDGVWGTILLINGKEEDCAVKEEDEIILIQPKGSRSESEVEARNVYPLAVGKYFWGEEVCDEINADEFDEEHNFEYYCPSRGENCFDFEVG